MASKVSTSSLLVTPGADSPQVRKTQLFPAKQAVAEVAETGDRQRPRTKSGHPAPDQIEYQMTGRAPARRGPSEHPPQKPSRTEVVRTARPQQSRPEHEIKTEGSIVDPLQASDFEKSGMTFRPRPDDSHLPEYRTSKKPSVHGRVLHREVDIDPKIPAQREYTSDYYSSDEEVDVRGEL